LNPSGTLFAFDAASGIKLWSMAITAMGIDSPPVVVNGTIYLGVIDGSANLYAIGLSQEANLHLTTVRIQAMNTEMRH